MCINCVFFSFELFAILRNLQFCAGSAALITELIYIYMAEIKVVEEKLEVLRANAKELDGEISATEADSELSGTDKKQRGTVFSERITQDLLAVDGVEISKSGASEALLRKDRKTAQKMAVLLARRKRLIQDLHKLAERVDKLSDDNDNESNENEKNDTEGGGNVDAKEGGAN